MANLARKSKPKVAVAAPAYKFRDRRGENVYGAGGGNNLVKSATQTYRRQSLPSLARDFHRNVSSYGRRTLMTLGRWLFWNFPALQGAILEQANLAVGTFIPQSKAKDKGWANEAEQWLTEWHRIMDFAGGVNDYDSFIQMHVILPMVDGDVGTLLTENQDGYPLIQVFPAHRISCDESTVDGGPYDGSTVIDGVIVDEYNRPQAYRIPVGDSEFLDIPVRDMFLSFQPTAPLQVRGLSALSSSAFDWQDSAEIRRYELIAQKAFASQAIVEHNETGDTDEARTLVGSVGTFDGTKRTAPDVEILDGGTVRYFRANSGSKLESFNWDRPNANAQEFIERIVRDAFRGAEMDSLFALDPKQVGGAPMRVIVEKLNAVLRKRRKLVEKACRRVDGYAIAKAIKLGLLAPNDDWWRWEYQGPGDVTADRKYDSDVDLQEITQGIATRKAAIARRGGYIEEVDEQREEEARSDLQRAQRLASEFNITIQQALVVLRPPTPSGALPNDNSGGADTAPSQ